MKHLSLILFIVSTLFARYEIQVGDTTWVYDQSTFQAFYMFEAITIDGQDVEETDVIGAFFNGECVGFVYANPTADGGQGTGFTTLPLMGNDGDFPTYMSNGEIPDLQGSRCECSRKRRYFFRTDSTRRGHQGQSRCSRGVTQKAWRQDW